jgi:hypothetical protein
VTLYVDLREQVGADREQDRGNAAEDHEVGRDAERETAAEGAAQAVDAVAPRVSGDRFPKHAEALLSARFTLSSIPPQAIAL